MGSTKTNPKTQGLIPVKSGADYFKKACCVKRLPG